MVAVVLVVNLTRRHSNCKVLLHRSNPEGWLTRSCSDHCITFTLSWSLARETLTNTYYAMDTKLAKSTALSDYTRMWLLDYYDIMTLHILWHHGHSTSPQILATKPILFTKYVCSWWQTFMVSMPCVEFCYLNMLRASSMGSVVQLFSLSVVCPLCSVLALESDPFVMSEPDPAKSSALESCLWELKVM